MYQQGEPECVKEAFVQGSPVTTVVEVYPPPHGRSITGEFGMEEGCLEGTPSNRPIHSIAGGVANHWAIGTTSRGPPTENPLSSGPTEPGFNTPDKVERPDCAVSLAFSDGPTSQTSLRSPTWSQAAVDFPAPADHRSQQYNLDILLKFLPSQRDFENYINRMESLLRRELEEVTRSASEVSHRVNTLEQQQTTTEQRLEALERVQAATQQALSDSKQQTTRALMHLDDENRSCRNNIRIRGLPEVPENSNLRDTVTWIFNNVLDKPPGECIEIDRVHRALGPRSADPARPRDVVCRVHFFRVKEDIMRRAWEKGPIMRNGSQLTLLPDLARRTLLMHRVMKPLLEAIKSTFIRWSQGGADRIKDASGIPGGYTCCGDDFNIPMQPELDTSSGGSAVSLSKRNRLKKIIFHLQLVDSWRVLHGRDKDFSFYSATRNSYSRIDYFFLHHLAMEWAPRAWIGQILWSDHAPVFLSVALPGLYPKSWSWRLNNNLLGDAACLSGVGKVISEFLKNHEQDPTPLPYQWEALKCMVKGEFIKHGARLKRERASQISQTLLQIQALELDHKRNPSGTILVDLMKARDKLQGLYNQAYMRFTEAEVALKEFENFGHVGNFKIKSEALNISLPRQTVEQLKLQAVAKKGKGLPFGVGEYGGSQQFFSSFVLKQDCSQFATGYHFLFSNLVLLYYIAAGQLDPGYLAVHCRCGRRRGPAERLFSFSYTIGNLLQVLWLASLRLIAYELLHSMVRRRVDDFFCNGDQGENGFLYPPLIETQEPDLEILGAAFLVLRKAISIVSKCKSPNPSIAADELIDKIKHDFPSEKAATNGPYLAIIEQPKQRGFRFRYVCEGPSHGGLPGASSEKGKKTYPTVKIFNYVGMAKIEVDLVTHLDPPQVHAHSLVGKHSNETGSCVVSVGPKDMTAQFNNLGIVHVTKRSQIEILKEKIRQQILRRRSLTEQDEKKIDAEVKDLKKVTDLSIVRLRFTAYLPDSTGAYTLRLKPVISDPIHDSKSPGASNLRISRMDKTAGSVKGGDEIYLLCDKVQKDDIEVRFYEDDDNGWQAFGDFAPTDVHKQYAIVFRTPPYHRQKIDRPVTVFLQLKRKRGGDVSDSKQFTYYPLEQDKEEVERKRRKDLPSLNHSFGGGAPMGGAGGGGGVGPGGFGHGGGNNMNYTYGGGMHSGFYSHYSGVYQGGGCMMNNSSETPDQKVDVKKEAEESSSSPVPENVPCNQRESRYQEALRQAHTCNMKMLSLAQRTSRALMDYAVTADPRMLLAMQRPLAATQDENGDTPLHLAVIHGQTAVVQQLVDVIRSDPNRRILNICNSLHQTPLHLAVITKQYHTVANLLRAGADPTILDRCGNSVLHLAVQAGDETMLQVLLEFSESKNLLNMPDYHGLYPVHWAVKVKNEKCLEQLVICGADINAAERKSGRSPLHIAVEMDSLNMAITLTKKLGANVNAQTFGGNTPLHLAASMGSPVLTKMLINAGANVLVENDEPVQEAASSDSDEVDSGSDVHMDTDSEDSDSEDSEASDTEQETQRIQCGVKRRHPGHTAMDLTRSQKVRDILSKHSARETVCRPTEQKSENVLSLETNTIQRLEKLLNEGQTGSDWKELASRLSLQNLVDTFKNTSSPTQNLLHNYALAGGNLANLIKTLESMGLNEGVKLLCSSDTYIKQAEQAKELTVDSAYESQSIDTEPSAELPSHKPLHPATTSSSPTQELAPETEPACGL
ncbi:nuclear factor NF-kappa-B p100 subunit [Gastrophryne carolinensis]